MAVVKAATKKLKGLLDDLLDDKLQFLHNTSSDAIRAYENIGGAPMPSLAVTRGDIPFESFGDITLVGKPSAFDPKRAANKLYSSDAYTIRAPRPIRQAKKGAGRKFQDVYEDQIKQLGGYTDTVNSALWDLETKRGLSEYEYDNVKRFFNDGWETDALFLREQGIPVPLKPDGNVDTMALGQMIRENYKPEKSSWAQSKMDELFEPQEYFISNPDRDFYTTSPRLKEYTAENLTNWMKRRTGTGQEGGMASKGMGAQRASTSEQISSLADAKSRLGLLASQSDAEDVYSKNQDKFFELADQFKPRYKYDANSFMYLNEFSEAVQMAGKRGGSENAIQSAFKEVGFDVDDIDVGEIKGYLDNLRSSPVQYFESKPSRVVGLDEFGGAIVPENTPTDIIDLLQNRGMQIEQYADEPSRLAARSKFKDFAFQSAGAAPAIGATGLLGLGSDQAYAGSVLPPNTPNVGQRIEAPVNPRTEMAAGLLGKLNRRLENRGLGLLAREDLENLLRKSAYGDEITYLDLVFAALDVAP